MKTIFRWFFGFNSDYTMSLSEHRIPEDKTQEVFTLAAQLYAQHNQSYSVKELMEAGTEAKIPPEFIQQAIEELQLQWSPTTPSVTKRSKALLLSLAIGLPALLSLGAVGWLLTRNAATTTQGAKAPVETVTPISSQPQVGDAMQGTGNFKCAGLNLEGQDLRTENFKGADCTKAKLTKANLSGVNLEGANLSHTDLKNAKMNDVNLKGADLADANLADANLSGANLEGANLSHTNLENANLTNTNTKGADLAGANLTGAKK